MAPGNGELSADTDLLRQFGSRVLGAIETASESRGFQRSGATDRAIATVDPDVNGGGWRFQGKNQTLSDNVNKAMNFGYVGGLEKSNSFWAMHGLRLADAENFVNKMRVGFQTLGYGARYCAGELERGDGVNAKQIATSVLRTNPKPHKRASQESGDNGQTN